MKMKIKEKINIDLAIVASQIPGGAIHDKRLLHLLNLMEVGKQ